MKTNRTRKNKIFTVLFCAIIGGLCIASLLLPDRGFSQVENRELQLAPILRIGNVIDGSFGKSFEQYAQDQFPGRDLWMKAKTAIDKYTGRFDNGNVYFGHEGRLFAKEHLDETQLAKNLEYINEFSARYADTGMRLSLLVAPTADSVQQRYLPRGVRAVLPDETPALASLSQNAHIPFCDVSGTLAAHADEYIYYRTDHHWTTRGAYYAYAQWIEECAGMKAAPESAFSVTKVADDFLGTSYSKAPLPLQKMDTIYRYDSLHSSAIKMTVEDAALTAVSTSDSLYDTSYLKKKDKYAYFLSSNNPVTLIESKADTGRRLLMLKDSYGNSFVPFLTEHFNEIVVVDMRYYRNSPQALIERYGITDMVFLYNIQTLSSDNNLVYLMRT